MGRVQGGVQPLPHARPRAGQVPAPLLPQHGRPLDDGAHHVLRAQNLKQHGGVGDREWYTYSHGHLTLGVDLDRHTVDI